MFSALRNSIYRKEMMLSVLALLTFFFGLNRSLVEAFYSTGIYLFISRSLRFCFGNIPFSVGDLLYGVVLVVIIYWIVKAIKKWRLKQFNRQSWQSVIRKIFRLVLIIYLVFQWEWGLNYHRLGSAFQLSIQPEMYSAGELIRLSDTLRNRLALEVSSMSSADSASWQNFDSMRAQAIIDYKAVANDYPFLLYKNPSVKQMLVGSIGGYGGFSGYLNPFTGEAQLNGNLPGFLRPIVTCHEIGHQLGYAAEEEANMVGYLAARGSNNPAVRYSAYHDMMTYASRELYREDSTLYNKYIETLPPLVRQHSRQAREYYASFDNPVQTVVNQWYDLYLKANSQDKGVKSYSYVTAWLIAFAKKYGWDKI